MKEVTISSSEQNQRVDKYLRKYLKNAPLSFIYKLLRKKDVKVNGKRIKEDYILQENDFMQIYIRDEDYDNFMNNRSFTNYKIDFKVVYEDENILIVNKPVGLEVQEDDKNNLTSQVLTYLKNKGEYNEDENVGFKPAPAHRLDRNTSGLVIFGKNMLALQELNECFKSRKGIEKYYLALVFGNTKSKETLSFPLHKIENKSIVKVDFENGQNARTEYKKVWNNSEVSLLEVHLLTGRTHQIRVHMSYIGHPLVGDEKYGNFDQNKQFKAKFNYRYQFLHAYKIIFRNLTGKLSYLNDKIVIGELPEDKNVILNKLNCEKSTL